ncbi:MAG: hypothetical protein H0T76_05255 [Nannocystis sp.]|nr:hypothetical protein [Nannocystis sp.]MBA3545871.1 hypothetical protein [Nannocystis sp.]
MRPDRRSIFFGGTALAVVFACGPSAPIVPPANTHGLAVTTRAFHDHSWMSFVALSRPGLARAGAFGEFERGRVDAARALKYGGKPVWLTWKQDFELWPRAVPRDSFNRKRVSAPTEWASYALAAGEDGVCVGVDPRTLQLSGKIEQSFAHHPVFAQNGQALRYSVHINQPYYETVVQNKWYQGRSLVTDPRHQFPPASRGRPEHGATVIKAAWIVLTPEQAADRALRARFYVEEAQIAPAGIESVMGPVQCAPASVALVGLHIMQKTAARPSWFWSSFEHKEVAPFGVETQPATPWLLAQSGAPATVPPKLEAGAVTAVPTPVGQRAINKQKFLKSMLARNDDYQTMLAGTVWANYRLVGTQWPSRVLFRKGKQDLLDGIGEDPAKFDRIVRRRAGRSVPANHVTNMTMEAYFLEPDPRQQDLGSSCMQCHYRASHWDYSYVLEFQGFANQGVPDPPGLPAEPAEPVVPVAPVVPAVPAAPPEPVPSPEPATSPAPTL